MGCSFRPLSWSRSDPVKPISPRNANPDPSRFEILRCEYINGKTVLEVKYIDCINFEGNKILILKGDYRPAIKHGTLNSLDPHFFPKSDLIARFVPTGIGWSMAKSFANGWEMAKAY